MPNGMMLGPFEGSPPEGLLEALMGRGEKREPPPVPQPDATAASLLEKFAAFSEPVPDFQPGDLVTFKPVLDSRAVAWRGQPLVVTADKREDFDDRTLRRLGGVEGKLDIVVGDLDADGDLVFVVTDRRFLMPWANPYAGKPQDGEAAKS